MQATYQTPVAGPQIAGVAIKHVAINVETGTMHVTFQEVDASGAPLGPPKPIVLGPAAASAVLTWLKNNLAGPLGNALGQTVASIA